jgi:predicted CoA-binding protein
MESSTVSSTEVMKKHKVIAVVGASKSPTKEAHTVPLYLKGNGYRIVPINPSADEILGERAYPSLLDLPDSLAKEIEVVEVFRPSEELPDVARQVVQLSKRHQRPYVFWSQLGLENEDAKKILTENGVPYVMNSCMRVVRASMDGA